MKKKIIEIIGFGLEPERAELMAQQILDLFVISGWVSVSEKLPELHSLGMSRDVLTIAGSKMSVKRYDYELGRWTGSPHITVKYWTKLPEPPYC